jgi:hypothetical protein
MSIIKKKKNYIKFAKNGVLNKPGFNSVAAFSYCIESGFSLDEEINKDSYITNQSYFAISACNRTIELDLEIYEEDQYENSLFKIRQLKKALNQLEKDLIKSRIIIVKCKVIHKEIKSKDEKI